MLWSMFGRERRQIGAADGTVYLYVFLLCFDDHTVVPLPGVCSHHLGNKTGIGGERVEHVDDLPAVGVLLTGYAEKDVAPFQCAERRVDGFPVALRRE